MDKLFTKRPYEAPRLTAVSFRAERGYVASNSLQLFLLDTENDSRNIEDYTESDNGWSLGSENFWK